MEENNIKQCVTEVKAMEYMTVRDFRTSTKSIWEKLDKNGEIIVTNNGRPAALMLSIRDGEFEQLLKAVRQTKAMMAVNNMRAVAAENGYLTDEEIEAEIMAYRKENQKDKTVQG